MTLAHCDDVGRERPAVGDLRDLGRDAGGMRTGSRHPNEIVFHPRSPKAWVGQLMVRVETVTDHWDGEA